MNYELICTKVISIARLAGNFIRREAMLFDASRIEYKGLNDMVSYVDKTAEQKLVANLSKLLPDAGFITEENTVSISGKTYTWIIDPLDGTTNFIHGIPTYAVSIALYEEDKPVVGVVYEINRGEMFYAYKGGAAYLNKKEIAVSKRDTLGSSLLATGFPYYQFDKQPQYMNLFAQMMRECHGLRRIGSAATDLIYVACGRFEAFFEYNLQQWDFAAGAFIVQQAGGEVCNFSGGNDYFNTREILATNGLVTKEILKAIETHFK
ncbi:inositol monophosphatase family protein [Pedobacter sp. SYP-B3415]|uniref:inositol monophosphatase family protein n=1 Tax=Pedobacter sp. SYP-B3415 TaxID=2496641 RepID=UPI00101D214E|nr:inositol monophosphatase family protein [Pedobacter sp. SYP-B3415]